MCAELSGRYKAHGSRLHWVAPKIALENLSGKAATSAFRDLSRDITLTQDSLAGDTGVTV